MLHTGSQHRSPLKRAFLLVGLGLLFGASPALAAVKADPKIITELAPHLPGVAELVAERDRQLEAKQSDGAIATAQKLVDGMARSATATVAERSRAEEFLSETLLEAKRYEPAFGWAIHAAAVAADLAPIAPPAKLAADKADAAALIARMPLTRENYLSFFILHRASLIGQRAQRPDLTKLVADRVADAAPQILSNSRLMAQIWDRAGTTDLQLGLGVTAEMRLRKAFELSSAADGESAPRTQAILANLAAALSLEGKTGEAETLARRAFATMSATPSVPASVSSQITLRLARILADSGKTEEAGALADAVITSDLARGVLAPIQAYTVSGQARLAAGDTAGAIERFEYAIVVAAQSTGSFSARMRPSLYMARSLIAQDRWLKAQQYMLGNAILLYSEDRKDENFSKFTSGKESWTKRLSYFSGEFNRSANGEDVALYDELLLRFAVRYEEEPGKDMARARVLMAAANAQVDRLGFLPRDELASRWSASAARLRNLLFADYAWMSRAVFKPAEAHRNKADAFAALQRSQTSTASQAIAQLAARSLSEAISPVLGSAARRREELVARWSVLDRARVLAIGAAPADPALAGQIAGVEAEMQTLDDVLRASAPEYFSYIRPAPLTESEASALFGPDEAALLIVPSEDGTHIMAVTDKGVNWFHSELAESGVNDAVRRLLWFAGGGGEVSQAEVATWQDEVPGDNAFDRTAAWVLWKKLVEPALPALAGKKQLVIAADGALAMLPFGMLVSQKPQGDDNDPAALRATRWMADDFALSQVPSLQSLALLRSAKKRAAGTAFSGWGDPELDGTAATRGGRGKSGGVTMARVFGTTRSAQGAGLADISQLRKLARLPGTAEELTAMARAFAAPAGSVHLEDKATETAIKAANLADAGILAFATHGLTAGEISGVVEPGLVLTPPDVSGAMDDGLLTASEVARLNLAADWVILSACNTAAGDGTTGAQGLSGLARAFFYAGARNLLVSHWPVRDDVAARLTVRTIEIARDNPALTRAAALGKAMKEIRNSTAADRPGDTWANPNAWAPFTLVGDGAR